MSDEKSLIGQERKRSQEMGEIPLRVGERARPSPGAVEVAVERPVPHERLEPSGSLLVLRPLSLENRAHAPADPSGSRRVRQWLQGLTHRAVEEQTESTP